MGAITSAVIAIAAVILGWITIEIACKPCLDQGRQAIDRSLDPNYDPDVENLQAPLNPQVDSIMNHKDNAGAVSNDHGSSAPVLIKSV